VDPQQQLRSCTRDAGGMRRRIRVIVMLSGLPPCMVHPRQNRDRSYEMQQPGIPQTVYWPLCFWSLHHFHNTHVAVSRYLASVHA
jgi:hypothetical protein